MTAYELADYLDEFFECYVSNDAFEEAATMLRQQQAEIEALRIRLKMEFEYAEKLIKEKNK